ncbi:hypothetical protein PHLGIDRAFT_74648 [Phlebiopsis gigantea 11061_1 CR5-6]|uniref:G-patch domain-containing protein n=1 Tax=Phlebiopsis gigantea (strain 11061_1 CR5-6) TaxID=745531 RepID=A0A0C3S8A3_PHLG1|nr:hypothetical protein PHLGIDRAFT_74648 [Phlebiopsis gigantea 11061_1 CR5-6]
MATVTHYIYSHYDPKDKEALEIATGQISTSQLTEPPDDSDDPWQTESHFGANRRLANAPRFVPAVVSYDEINNMMGIPAHILAPPAPGPKSEVASWYRSLTRQTRAPQAEASSSTVVPPPVAALPDSTPAATATLVPAPPSSSDSASRQHIRPDKNTWFITRALRSGPPSKPASQALTLADLLAREPPASSPEQAVKPPVFLALGPANRGWSMLHQQGWAEGEGLGATAPRQADSRSRTNKPAISPSSAKKGKAVARTLVKQEEREVQLDSDGDVSEVRKVEVVDLTLSDSDEDGAVDADAVEILESLANPPPFTLLSPTVLADPHTKPLLTPIPTVLKSDRLGVGLKAKTVGPYKASKKRVTHNQAALAAHIREADELRQLKALVGKGSRGFARLAKADSERRRQLIASLNTS